MDNNKEFSRSNLNLWMIIGISVALLGLGLVGAFYFFQEKESGPGTGSGLKILPDPNGIYLGAYDFNNGLKVFEQAIGKKAAIWGQPSFIKDGGTEETLPKFDREGHEKAWQEGYLTFFGIEYSIDSRTHLPQAIIDGSLDSQIKQAAQEIKDWGRPIFWIYQREPIIQPVLRFGGGGYGPAGDKKENEVADKYGAFGCADSGNIMCLDGPERYRAAAKHIHDLVESIAPNRVTWVMGANTGWQAGQYKMFYPGDDYVDWHAFDRYIGAESSQIAYQSLANHILWQEALNLADKPIMILELGVHYGFGGSRHDRAGWWQDFFEDVRINPQMENLKALVYWQMGEDAFDGSYTRIEPGQASARAWQEEIKNYPDFWLSEVKLGN